ncbi:MAG: Mur ligase family protein [Deltaproteobacteria bacterium]|nr:Mur ligase family protein [Deltaproteobacteria bacterium]
MKSHPFLDKLKNKGITLGLDRIYNALAEIDNPHNFQKGALIGGTNGKGSTSYMLYTLLAKSGFSTSLYTSPHINEINDRYLINNQNITDEKLNFYINNLKWLADKYNLTLFEFETLIAFKYFNDAKVDFAIYEVGMGGRLDATNCFNPFIKIITSISKDHVEFLGDTLEKILYEKAGIVKEGNLLITGIEDKSLISLLKRYCQEKKSEILVIHEDFFISNIREYDIYEIFDFSYKDIKLSNIKLSMYGRHQVNNCALSIVAFLELTKKYGYKIDRNIIYDSLSTIKFSGRFEVYSRDPLIIIDGAHNTDGIQKLKESVSSFNRKEKKILTIFSTLRNKDPIGKINILKDITERFIFVENDHPLTLKNHEFYILAKQANLRYFELMNIDTAIKKIFEEYKDFLILITGSLYSLPEIYKQLEKYRYYGGQR